jgi:phage protein D
MALGQPMLAPQTPVRVCGWKPQIDDTEWLTIKVCHKMTPDGGFTTRVELETAGVAVEEPSAMQE